MEKLPLSVLITARDEETMLPGALASLPPWVGEVVVVVDSRTQDRTREKALEFGAKVVENNFQSSAQQCNFGLEQCAFPWVFVLDADERLSEDLCASLRQTLEEAKKKAYACRRRNFCLGRPMRWGDWGRDWVVRLFLKQEHAFTERAVHGRVPAQGPGKLEGFLEHYTFRSFDQYLAKLTDYASRGAQELLKKRQSVSFPEVIARAEWRFLRAFFLRLGFLDGHRGFLLAVLGAYGTFLKWGALWCHLNGEQRPSVHGI